MGSHWSAKTRWCLAALQLAASAAAAQSPGLDRLLPAAPTGYVTDVAGVIDAGSRREMESLIERLRGATGAEIAVVTLPTIGDYAPVDIAVALGRKWGVGAAAEIGDERRNAGLVVLLVPRREGDDNSGHIFIATGGGVEGIVTDAEAGRVRDRMLPALRRAEYGPALLLGVRSLVSTLARGFGVEDTTLVDRDREIAAERGSPRPATLLLGLFVGMVVLSLVISAAARSRHPVQRGRRRRRRDIYWGGGWGGGGFGGGFGGGAGGGGFGGFGGGGGGFGGGGAGGRF